MLRASKDEKGDTGHMTSTESRQDESSEATNEMEKEGTAVNARLEDQVFPDHPANGDEASAREDQRKLADLDMIYLKTFRGRSSGPRLSDNEEENDSHKGNDDEGATSDVDYFDPNPDDSLSLASDFLDRLEEARVIQGIGRDWEWLDLGDDSDLEMGEGADQPPGKPHFPQGPLTTTECFVCFEEVSLRRRLCCDFPVCDSCLVSYLVVQVSQATVHIECLNSNCQSYIHRDEILSRLPVHMKSKFYKFLIDANLDPTLKTCPRCSNALRVERAMLKKRKVVTNGLYVTCPKCSLEWCFTCHAPWHKGLTCKEFRKGDALLKDWAREFHYGQLNAQKCPKCKIYIQRSLGCDHMTCSRCETSFCYRCGEHYRSVKLLGNHFSRLSPFGCRYNFMPDAPHTRRLIRGAVLGGKLLAGLGLAGFVAAAGVFLLGVSVVVLPVWGGYKLHKRRRYRQQLKRQRKRTNPNYAHSVAIRPEPSVLNMKPVRVLDNSDSTIDWDDSSDETRDHMHQLVLDLQLPDSQRVEVLVHRTVGYNSDQEEQGATGGRKEGGGACEPSIILTDVQEVTNEEGYTTYVTHIYAKQMEDKGQQGTMSDASSDSGDETDPESKFDGAGMKEELKRSSRHQRLRATQEAGQSSGQPKTAASFASYDVNDSASGKKDESKTDDKEESRPNQKTTLSVVLSKECTWKTTDGEKSMDILLQRLKDRRQKEKEREKEKDKEKEREQEGEKDREKENGREKELSTEEGKTECSSPDQFAKEGTNGCFGNIFAKKLTALSNSSHVTTDNVLGRQKIPWRNKSATWEKNGEKGAQRKHVGSIDFCDAVQCKDRDLPLTNGDCDICKGGVLLQDCVVLNGNDNLNSNAEESDGMSLASSQSLDDERVGEKESACSLSASEGFRGSVLSCDIVTYL